MEPATTGRAGNRPSNALSNQELVELAELFLSDPNNREVEERLAASCLAEITKIIKGYVYSHRIPNIVIDDAISLAQLNLAHNIRDLTSPDHLKSWLIKVARTAAITEFLRFIGRGVTERIRVPLETSDEAGKRVQTLDLDKNREAAARNWPSGTGAFPDPHRWTEDREKRRILDYVLEDHICEGTKRDRDSALWIKTKLSEELSIEEISKARGTTKDDVWHLFRHDTPGLFRRYRERTRGGTETRGTPS